MVKYFLSASKLNLLRDCPRCFWRSVHLKDERPRGIVASIMNGVDLALKEVYEQYRGTLPREYVGAVGGVLMGDTEKLRKWRHWKTGLQCVSESLGVKIIGAIDDCVISPAGAYRPLDYKTKGKEPDDPGLQYYQTQHDIYQLLFHKNGLKVDGVAYLAYYFPVADRELGWGCKVFEISASAEQGVKTITDAVKVLDGEEPPASKTCEYCAYRANAQKGE